VPSGLWSRAAVIFGLSAMAVVQPVLDLFGKNPEFFVAGNYGAGQIVWFAILVAIVPPLVGTALVAGASLVNERLGSIVFATVVGGLATAFALALLRTIGVDQVVLVAVVAVLIGCGIAALVLRTRGGRLLVTYLAAANLLFVGSFLLISPASELVAGGSVGDLGHIDVPDLRAPVVLVVLDELPAATIMRGDGSLNEDRYPGFAELTSVSTWFRNASSQYHLTHRAVPSILDGRLSDRDDLPTYDDHPRNLFTLLGQSVPVHRYESVTDLCPESVCTPPPRQPLSRAIEDASIVYGHRVLPSSLRDELPAIDNSWGSYGVEDDTPDDELVRQETAAASDVRESHIDRAYAKWKGLAAEERSPLGQAGVLRDRIAEITAEPALHFVHVALPHRPWVLTREGATLASKPPEPPEDPSAPRYDDAVRMEYQLHSMQVGAADTLVGQLVDHLRALPNWKDVLLVVTSDHGTNLTAPDIGRTTITDANREEIYRVPLFVKAPGQLTGEVRDDSVQTIDLLPSIIDLLGASTNWTFDGHSMYDASAATTPPRVTTDVAGVLEIAARRAEVFPHGDDWFGLAAVGEHGELVGEQLSSLEVGAPSTLTARVDQRRLFDDLPTPDGELPLVLTGTVTGSDEEPPDLIVAIEGTIAGVVGGYVPRGGAWAFRGYVADAYQAGRNTVTLYEVDGDGDDAVLRPVR
jgi:Sulfatase